MSDARIGRRQLVRTAAVVTAGGALAVGTGVGSASAHENDDDHRHGLLGSWVLEHRNDPPAPPAPGTSIVSFAQGGVIIDNDITPDPLVRSGSWSMTGRSTFKATLWSAAPADVGVAGATMRVQVVGRLHRDTFEGTAVITAFAPGGGQLFAGTGIFTGTRLRA